MGEVCCCLHCLPVTVCQFLFWYICTCKVGCVCVGGGGGGEEGVGGAYSLIHVSCCLCWRGGGCEVSYLCFLLSLYDLDIERDIKYQTVIIDNVVVRTLSENTALTNFHLSFFFQKKYDKKYVKISSAH